MLLIHAHFQPVSVAIRYYAINVLSSLTATYIGIRESIASTEGAMCQLNNVLKAADSINSSSAVVGVLGTFENLSERYYFYEGTSTVGDNKHNPHYLHI